METSKNKLWDVDEQLFASLEGKYQSDNEALFFRNMKFKQEYEPTLSNDLIVSESDNEDEIYLVRIVYDEYLVGKGGGEDCEVHVMNLSEALTVDLRTIGLNRKMTLLEWLKQRDYAGVLYDNNYDDR